MKIAFDSQIFTTQTYGGISRYYSVLADRLVQRGQNIRIFAGLHRNSHIRNLSQGVVAGVGLKKYPPKVGRFFIGLNTAFAACGARLWQPDIIHETYYSALPVLSGRAARVATVHDMTHELLPESFPARDQTSRRKLKAVRRADHLICVSHNTKRDLVDILGVDENNISVVHLGVDAGFFQQPGQPLFGFERPFVLFVGDRGGYKNFNGLLQAIAHSGTLKAELDVVAFGGGTFAGSELELIDKLGFADNQVRHVGGPDRVLAWLYQQAVAFVYPSRYEGFGLPPLEAMAAGCPVVTSNRSSIPEVVGDAGMYFDPGCIEEMSQVIEQVLCSDSIRAGLIERGYENVGRFSWDKCADETLAVYRRLLGQS